MTDETLPVTPDERVHYLDMFVVGDELPTDDPDTTVTVLDRTVYDSCDELPTGRGPTRHDDGLRSLQAQADDREEKQFNIDDDEPYVVYEICVDGDTHLTLAPSLCGALEFWRDPADTTPSVRTLMQYPHSGALPISLCWENRSLDLDPQEAFELCFMVQQHTDNSGLHALFGVESDDHLMSVCTALQDAIELQDVRDRTSDFELAHEVNHES